MEIEFCGRQAYRGIFFDVYWNSVTKRVTLQRTDESAFTQKNNYTAQSKAEALVVAKDIIMTNARR